VSSFYASINRSKKSVAVDLKTDEGVAALRKLIPTADVLIESFRPGSLSRLGFGYEDIAALHRALIYCSISGYGQTGPCAQLPGYDVVIQAEAGMMDMTGWTDREPTRAGIALTDYLAGLYAAVRARVHTADIESSSRRLGQAAGRHRRGHRAPRPFAASRARAEVRAAQLADESADRLAHRGRDEVELTSLDRPPPMAGFAVSVNGRFSAVHRGTIIPLHRLS
jgi:hypothetical protein